MKFPNILTLFRRPAPQPEPAPAAAPLATDVMVDLETFGTQGNAVIAAIGAVGFDEGAIFRFGDYTTGIDIQTCLDAGLTINGGTLYWWLN